jgi:flagellar hook-length control protein FliK
MIQSISATRAAGASAESALPTPVRAANGGQPAAGRQLTGDTMRGFGERMQLASSESEALPGGLPAALLQGALPAPAAEQGQVMQLGGTATQGAEAPQELTPEQWLLGMIDQQLAEIQARDAGRLGAASDPVPQALPEAVVPPAEELLAWLPGQAPLVDQPFQSAQADPLQALMTGGFQRQAAEANLVMPAMPKPTVEVSLALPAVAPTLAETLPTASLEPLLSTAEPLEAGEPLTSTVERGQTTLAQAADRALKLQAPETKWGEQMLHALRENVDLQIQQKTQSATIRLDPPELGSMEIMLSHESGRLNVHLTAANVDVARLLQQTSDRLRQELVGQHFVQVNVQVGADSGGQQGQQRQRAALAGEELPLAARPHEQEQNRESGRPRDVLITV